MNNKIKALVKEIRRHSEKESAMLYGSFASWKTSTDAIFDAISDIWGIDIKEIHAHITSIEDEIIEEERRELEEELAH